MNSLKQPIFVVGPPRAGARLIARALAAAPGTWMPAGGAGALLSGIPELDPPDGQRGGRLRAEDCSKQLRDRLLVALRRQASARSDSAQLRLFDASPRNALAVPFLDAAFPDATFVYVHRTPADALTESLALWRAGSAVTYPALPGWSGPPWSFSLVPGWRELSGLPLAEVVTEQWVRTMQMLLPDLEQLPGPRWCVTDHERLLISPRAELERLFAFLELEPSEAAVRALTDGGYSTGAANLPDRHDELQRYLIRTRQLAAYAYDWIAD